MKFLSHNERNVLRLVLRKWLVEGEMIKEKNFISAQKAEYRTSFIVISVSYTHLRAHETGAYLVCRLLLEKKKKNNTN